MRYIEPRGRILAPRGAFRTGATCRVISTRPPVFPSSCSAS